MTLVSDDTGFPAEPEKPSARSSASGIRRDLTVWTEQSGNRCLLRLSGRLSADTVVSFDGHVDTLGCRWCDRVVVDLAELTVLDLVGARLLVGLSHYVAGRGGSFRIEGASPYMESMLATAGVELSN